MMMELTICLNDEPDAMLECWIGEWWYGSGRVDIKMIHIYWEMDISNSVELRVSFRRKF